MAAPPHDDHERTVNRADRTPPAGAGGGGTPAGPAATPLPPSPAGPYVPGYVVTGEIARGSMGVVLAALEVSLDREVAIKMLLPGAAGRARAARRFVDEARITARLQHPCVPPVYQVGALADGRPFLAMKLIRGRTLAAILTARAHRPSSRSADELDLTALDSPGLLHVFEQLCQAVGFAHARGVVHRDLKPSNVMVGSFGEVQVMDWGIAKDGRRPPPPADPTPDPDARDGRRSALDTMAGQVMGTPQYMPPEQARGEWGRVDARADVFALGGILAAILTGSPPYPGTDPDAVLRRAAAADLAECLDRLDGSGADPELVRLAAWCLAPTPDERPADGAEVARRVAAYRVSVAARLVTAESERAAAAATVAEARRLARAEGLARQAAEERADDAEWFVQNLTRQARRDARRRRGVGVAAAVAVVVLATAYVTRREPAERPERPRPAPPAPVGVAEPRPAVDRTRHAAAHERRSP
jgi:serine/threonine protein kinase